MKLICSRLFLDFLGLYFYFITHLYLKMHFFKNLLKLLFHKDITLLW